MAVYGANWMNLDRQRGHSLDELVRNLAETIAWGSSRPQPWSPLASFRSIDIAAEFGSNDRKSWVDSVARQRRRTLRRDAPRKSDISEKSKRNLWTETRYQLRH